MSEREVHKAKGFTTWPVSEQNVAQIARWTGGQIDLAEPPKGVFVPTLNGPVLAEFGSTVVCFHATGRFHVESDAQNLAQLYSNIDNAQGADTDLTSSPEFESEEDLQAHHQRKVRIEISPEATSLE